MQIDKDVWLEILRNGVGSVVRDWTRQDVSETAHRYGANNYAPLPVNLVRAEGPRVWDEQGREYIDCVGAYSAMAHGHLAPALIKAVRDQLHRTTLVSRAFEVPELALFDQLLAQYCELDQVCPMNTGAEAVETCIKLARKWAYTRKGVPKDQAEIIVCDHNFHGRTTTIVGFSTEEQYREMFGPYGPGFRVIPFGDADALRKAITPNTAAFLAEPIQAEAGVLVPPEGYLREVRRICTENNVLLIWDEVQTGFCRTGTKFAWMHEDAKPDLMAVGKALGGGILPVSAAVGLRHVMEVFEPGDHGSTFGGNPLACTVALTAMAVMETEDYALKSRDGGDFLRRGFLAAGGGLLKEVRGRGLLLGVEFVPEVNAKRAQSAFLENGLLTKETRSRTFRFAPPIMTDPTTLEEIVQRFAKAVGNL